MQQRIEASMKKNAKLAVGTGNQELIEEVKMSDTATGSGYGLATEEEDLFNKNRKITDREDDYHKKRLGRGRVLSPEREDVFK